MDLDGALNDPRKVAKFSGELWERLNGGTKGAHGEAQVAGESLWARGKREAMEAARRGHRAAEQRRRAFVARAAEQLDEQRTAEDLWELRKAWRECEEKCRPAAARDREELNDADFQYDSVILD